MYFNRRLIEKLDRCADSRTTAALRSTDLAHVILFSSQPAAERECEWMGEQAFARRACMYIAPQP